MAFPREKLIAVKILDKVCGGLIREEEIVSDSLGRDLASGDPVRLLLGVPKLKIMDGLGATHDAIAGVIDRGLIPSIRRDLNK